MSECSAYYCKAEKYIHFWECNVQLSWLRRSMASPAAASGQGYLCSNFSESAAAFCVFPSGVSALGDGTSVSQGYPGCCRMFGRSCVTHCQEHPASSVVTNQQFLQMLLHVLGKLVGSSAEPPLAENHWFGSGNLIGL